MKRTALLRTKLAAAAAAACMLGTSGVVLANTAFADQTMTATTWVNVRSGPGTSYGVVGVLSPSESVSSATSQGGWFKVTTSKGLSGWVYQTYLRATGSSAPAPAPSTNTSTATGQATATSAVNVRSGAGTSYGVVGVAQRGQTVSTTGRTSGGWTEVLWGGKASWISTSYLTTGSSSSTSPVAGQLRTTADLYLRTGGSTAFDYTGVLPANSVVDVTGRTTADYTEIIYQGKNSWIATRYTSAAAVTNPSAPSAPTASATVTVTVGMLNVRATSAADSAIVGTVYSGQELATTNVVVGDRLQVIYQGATRWVFKAYTSAGSAPASNLGTKIPAGLTTSGIAQLTPNARAVFDYVVANHPSIRTIYGWRASSDYSSDHPNGRAIDLMVANWSSQSSIDTGWAIAHDLQAKAKSLNISYLIWRQQLWNASYPERGWRAMEDRGSYTANHYDHVHVSVRA